MNQNEPVRPEDLNDAIPEQVIKVFNDLIARRYTGRTAVVYQVEVTDELLKRDPALTREQILRSNWLDVEDTYRAAGWLVTYDKPGWNESYPPSFTFTRASA